MSTDPFRVPAPASAAAPPTGGVQWPEAARPGSSPYDNAYTLPMPDPAAAFAGPGYYTPPPRTSTLAVLALVCALLGIVTYVPSVGAVVLGILAIRQTGKHRLKGRGLAETSLALGGVVLVGWSALLVAIYLVS